MENQQPDDTIQEILDEDQEEIRKSRKRGHFFLRLLLIVTIIFIGSYGFILFRQHLLDIEAQAVISAMQTATAAAKNPSGSAEPSASEGEAKIIKVSTPTPEVTRTPDAETHRTATIAAQLTSVADFRLTSTSE